MTPLADLFPDDDYRFRLTLRRVEPRDFFGPRDLGGKILAERARWLAEAPGRYAAMTPEGEPLLEEFWSLATEWGIPVALPGALGGSAGTSVLSASLRSRAGLHANTLAELGRSLEPDLLLLSPDSGGTFCLRAGALCFPTGWALEEKIGRPLDVIHGVVPGLNPAVGAAIAQFLARLKPGVAFCRDNWGLATTSDLNLHPSRAVPPPAPPVALDRLWLRVEHQALLALPRTGGVAFGIRIVLHRLDEIARDRVVAPRLARALASMPEEMARYKRVDTVRAAVVDLL